MRLLDPNKTFEITNRGSIYLDKSVGDWESSGSGEAFRRGAVLTYMLRVGPTSITEISEGHIPNKEVEGTFHTLYKLGLIAPQGGTVDEIKLSDLPPPSIVLTKARKAKVRGEINKLVEDMVFKTKYGVYPTPEDFLEEISNLVDRYPSLPPGEIATLASEALRKAMKSSEQEGV